jgi:hypothetical protein
MIVITTIIIIIIIITIAPEGDNPTTNLSDGPG